MKTIFFSELNLLNIILIIFFKLLRFKVYFISINKKLRNIQWIKIIEKLGIIWFSYQNYSIKNSDLKINVKNKKFTDKYSKMITELIWNKNLTRYFIPIKVIGLILLIQVVLGVLTLLYGAQIYLASMHQISSIFLISSSVYFLYLNSYSN